MKKYILTSLVVCILYTTTVYTTDTYTTYTQHLEERR